MKSIDTVCALAAAAALAAACGGGGDAVGPAAAAAPATPTALQAKALAARTIHAVFLADDVAAQLQHYNFAALDTYPSIFGLLDARCAQGSGRLVVTDQDQSTTLSQGDHAVFLLDACRPSSGSRWTFTGAPTLQVAGGSNVHGVWLSGEAGAVELRLQADTLVFAPGGSLSGTWSSVFTWGQPGAGLSNSLADTKLLMGTLTIHFLGVQFGGTDSVQHLSGQVSTWVEGLGTVNARLSLPVPLALDPQFAARYVPVSGTARVDAAGLSLDVIYGPTGAVMLQVDTDRDGTIDLRVATTAQELDSLMATTPAPGEQPLPDCLPPKLPDGGPLPCQQVNAFPNRVAATAEPGASVGDCGDCGRFAHVAGQRLWPAARGGIR